MPATYEPIASQTLGASAATVTFSSISGTFTDLIVVLEVVGASATRGYPAFRFNSDTGSNYSNTALYATSGGALSGRWSSQTELYLSNFITGFGSSNRFTSVTHILSYANTNVNKTVLTAAANDNVERSVGLWRSTSAITAIEIRGSQNFGSGSTFSLYGVKAA
jgi:hypothetical protein